MGQIVPFDFEGAQVRVLDRDGEPWFVLADVCRVLEISNARDAAGRLDDDEKDGVGITDAIGREQQTTIINESGLYSLILTSRKPSAKRFKKWVTAEVLPSIRKTGGYGKLADPTAALNDPAALRGLLLTYSEKVLALEAANAELTPKAEALDRLSTADGSLCVTDAAKAIQVQPKVLFSYLREHNWIYKRPGGKSYLGYQTRVAGGLLEHKVTTVLRSDGSEKIVEQVLITPRGLTKLAMLLQPIGAVVAAA